MKKLKDQVIRQLDDLSPAELQVVHQLIETFKQSPPAHQPDRAAVQRVRDALAHLPGDLSQMIREEREERI